MLPDVSASMLLTNCGIPVGMTQKNLAAFGKCANPNWHGHNYELFVTVKGIPDPDTGYCIDLKVLSDIIEEKVISQMDHKNLNLDVPFMTGKLTSCENVAIAIWDQLVEGLKGQSCQLHAVKVYETEIILWNILVDTK